jgi:hypothetical protein
MTLYYDIIQNNCSSCGEWHIYAVFFAFMNYKIKSKERENEA